MTRVMIRHHTLGIDTNGSCLCLVLCVLYACEATTAKERGRSLVAELEPWKRGPVGVPTIHKVQRHRRGDVA